VELKRNQRKRKKGGNSRGQWDEGDGGVFRNERAKWQKTSWGGGKKTEKRGL